MKTLENVVKIKYLERTLKINTACMKKLRAY
jgi:hypothetical protein